MKQIAFIILLVANAIQYGFLQVTTLSNECFILLKTHNAPVVHQDQQELRLTLSKILIFAAAGKIVEPFNCFQKT